MSYDPDVPACDHGNQYGCSECERSYSEDRDEFSNHDAKVAEARKRARYLINCAECCKAAGLPLEQIAGITHDELRAYLNATSPQAQSAFYGTPSLLEACIIAALRVQRRRKWRS